MTPQEQIALAGIAVAVVSALLTFVATRGKTRSDAKTQQDARIDARVDKQMERAWKKIDDLEARVVELTEKDQLKSTAMARILRAIARQWPDDHGPDLDPSDIALIEDTIPPQWMRKTR